MLQEGFQALRRGEVAFRIHERFPRAIGQGRRVRTGGRCGSPGDECARFLGALARLQRHRETCAHGHADQELEREVGHPTVYDLAERRLRDTEPPRCCELIDAPLPCPSRDLMRHIAAEGLNGCDVR